MSNNTISISSSGFDSRDFRNALGHFATGVTVVTGCTETGEKFGVTINSFNSVSLEPPLVLWSLDRNASTFEKFADAKHFCVHLLAEDQLELSNLFASVSDNKFDNLETASGIADIPLIEGCAACFQCRTHAVYEGGDHQIFIGEVLAFDDTDKAGLMFYKGNYAVSSPHPDI